MDKSKVPASESQPLAARAGLAGGNWEAGPSRLEPEIFPEEESAAAEPPVSSGVAAPEAEPEDAPARSGESASVEGEACFTLYLREIGRLKLLSRQEEQELAQRVQKGDKKAREQMIKCNLRLVVRIARDYEGIGLPLLDLISEGNLGLMRAVDRFDPGRGAKFSTYASWWIKQSIKRALSNQSKTIRLPIHMLDKISKMRKASARLLEELGREPTDEELADELDLSARQIARMRRAALPTASLDAPTGDEESCDLNELVADERADTPYEHLEEKMAAGMLQDLVNTLQPREIAILRARFGMDGGLPKTLEEVGADLGLTRERVRQLQNIALNKLRRLLENFETNGSNAARLAPV